MLTWQWISDFCHYEGYVLARMLGAYAVAADPTRPLKQLVRHNCLFDIQVGLAAVTLNRGETRVVLVLAEDLAAPQTPLCFQPLQRVRRTCRTRTEDSLAETRFTSLRSTGQQRQSQDPSQQRHETNRRRNGTRTQNDDRRKRRQQCRYLFHVMRASSITATSSAQ